MSPVKIPKRVRELKRKRPDFVRQESWRYIRLKPNWRRPRGKDSKMRLQRAGWPQLVKVGYRSPRRYRGLHPSGYKEILVYRVEDLAGLNPEVYAVRIAGSVGMAKRLKIVEEAEKLGLKVLNPPAVPATPVEEAAPEIVEPSAEEVATEEAVEEVREGEEAGEAKEEVEEKAEEDVRESGGGEA